MPIDKNAILEQLKQVNDPELHRDLVTLGKVRNVAYCDGHATISLDLPDPSHRQSITEQVEHAVRALGDEIQQVQVNFAVPHQQQGQAAGQQAEQPQEQQNPQEQARANNPLPGVKHMIAVGAGKGGVGKSMVAVNLAVGLARNGLRVGLLDGDIYGPSVPTMLGLDQHQPRARGQMLLPFELQGIKAMTIGALVEEEKPLIWRGPMAHGAFRQLATQTEWGELDYLIIDLPPGTGDVPLTLAQLLPLTGAVVVCTPQKVAQDDARRAINMFQQLGIHVLGLVENMSYFAGDDGVEYDIFGRGGAQMLAETEGVPCLGAVPINTRLCANADAGNPSANFEADDKLSQELDALTQKLLGQVSVLELSGAFDQPSISIQ